MARLLAQQYVVVISYNVRVALYVLYVFEYHIHPLLTCMRFWVSFDSVLSRHASQYGRLASLGRFS